MGTYLWQAFIRDVEPEKHSAATRRLAEMISKTAAALSRSQETVMATLRTQQRSCGCIEDLRKVKQNTCRAIERSEALLAARHNLESWCDAFARIETLKTHGS